MMLNWIRETSSRLGCGLFSSSRFRPCPPNGKTPVFRPRFQHNVVSHRYLFPIALLPKGFESCHRQSITGFSAFPKIMIPSKPAYFNSEPNHPPIPERVNQGLGYTWTPPINLLITYLNKTEIPRLPRLHPLPSHPCELRMCQNLLADNTLLLHILPILLEAQRFLAHSFPIFASIKYS